MENPYSAPTSDVRTQVEGENTSGMGKSATLPEGVKGWSWGAFFLTWIWGGFNKTYISFLTWIPYVGFIMAFVLGFKGREWAWRSKRWESVEHFNEVQRKWSFWGVVLFGSVMVLGILAAIAIPAYQDYLHAVEAAKSR